jgi:hypothetical protein
VRDEIQALNHRLLIDILSKELHFKQGLPSEGAEVGGREAFWSAGDLSHALLSNYVTGLVFEALVT